ncbi:histidinol-phosphatase [Lewinella sp. IMCC34183]|uniref:histidinol-phosphatase n=1 Tax=Lewinella sp. IMCC34183 TaxID=2248762 RepID=UPI0013009177|nr:histidinol-phosphatase [Lewinella sp. IMCC34183]
MLTNHHAHTRYSDGIGEPEDYLRQALREGFATYTFSDHAPIPPEDIGSMPLADLAAYGNEIDNLRVAYHDRIRIFKSLEVDFLPDVMNVNSPHIRSAGLDFTVGAVHYVDRLPDGRPWSFQQPEPVFSRGIDTIFGGDSRRMVERYYALLREMLVTHPPDIVAHLDRIKRRNATGDYWDENAPWYRAAVEETLDALQGAGAIMEVNTRGVYLNDGNGMYPSSWIVARAHARGIPLQVNSDAHRPEHVSGGFAEAYRLLRELGVNAVTVYMDGGFGETELPVLD